MPLYTAMIDLNEEAPYKSCAEFLSFLAYPEKSDGLRRRQLGRALQCWAIRLKAAGDPDWARHPQPIVPYLLAVDQIQAVKTQKRGYKFICDRFLCANGILFPALRALDPGCQPSGQEYLILNEIFPVIGWKTESVSTFKSAIWRPSRPVTPAAGALLNWMLGRGLSEQTVGQIWVDLSFSVQSLREVLDSAEEFRVVANEVKQYRLRESDTIRFEAAG
jgi:hypothetical protein